MDILKLLTKEALKDNNFGQNFFENDTKEEENIIKDSNLERANKLAFQYFTRSSEINIRRQMKQTRSRLGSLLVSAVEEYDEVMVGMHLAPEIKDEGKGENSEKPQDVDKIFRTYPSFDPVFMKVWKNEPSIWPLWFYFLSQRLLLYCQKRVYNPKNLDHDFQIDHDLDQ